MEVGTKKKNRRNKNRGGKRLKIQQIWMEISCDDCKNELI